MQDGEQVLDTGKKGRRRACTARWLIQLTPPTIFTTSKDQTLRLSWILLETNEQELQYRVHLSGRSADYSDSLIIPLYTAME